MPIAAIYLSRDDLLRFHDAVIRQHGGMPGVRDEDALESCLAQPRTFVFDVERFPSLIEKAAAYCFFIVRHHPFFDGNKRMGLAAAFRFLRINGLDADFDEQETYDVIMRTAKGETELDEIAAIIDAAVIRTRSSKPDPSADA